MGRATSTDAQALIHSLRSAYAATPSSLKIIDLYVGFAVFSAIIQVVYMAIVGSFPFNSFLSGVLSCIGTAVLAVCLRIQVNKENKEFKDLPSERAFADFVLCNLVLHLVIMNFLGNELATGIGDMISDSPGKYQVNHHFYDLTTLESCHGSW
uniref:Dolichyl-diphosphooligosaccharide--protein glycosyltransferase subunit DAD1 n=2 Tax=Salix TaxID=40685 RepID=A0A6N2KSY4_SALVM